MFMPLTITLAEAFFTILSNYLTKKFPMQDKNRESSKVQTYLHFSPQDTTTRVHKEFKIETINFLNEGKQIHNFNIINIIIAHRIIISKRRISLPSLISSVGDFNETRRKKFKNCPQTILVITLKKIC